MQLNWTFLRSFLVVSETGSLRAAASRLNVNATTVGRHIQNLEDSYGERLLTRGADGRLCVTDAGAHMQTHVRDMAEAAAFLETVPLRQRVRLSTVPVLANRVLVPHLPSLLADGGFELDLLAEARNVDVGLRDADVALRLGRPNLGGHSVLSRKVGVLPYVVAASAQTPPPTRWIKYADGFDLVPPAEWMAPKTETADVSVADADTAVEAVAVGLGKCFLPRMVVDADPRLVALEDAQSAPLERPLWVLVHSAARSRQSVDRVLVWLETLFETS